MRRVIAPTSRQTGKSEEAEKSNPPPIKAVILLGLGRLLGRLLRQDGAGGKKSQSNSGDTKYLGHHELPLITPACWSGSDATMLPSKMFP
jgi:hypothetical protein